MKGSNIFYLSNILQLIMRFAQMMTITHVVSAIDLGIYYAVSAYPQLLSRVFDMGLPHASRYFMLKLPNQKVKVTKLVSMFLGLMTVPIFGTFFVISQFPIETNDILSILTDSYIVLSLYCLGLVANSILNSILLSFERLKVILWAGIIPYSVFIGVVSYKYYFGALMVDDLIAQLLVSELITTGILLTGIRKIFLLQASDEGETLRASDILRYALKTYPGGLLKTASTRLDRVVLSFVASPAFIGYYSVLMTLRDISIVPATSYGQVFSNKLSVIMAGKGFNVERIVINKLAALMGLYVLGFFSFLIVQRPILSMFFGVVTEEVVFASWLLMLSCIPMALVAFLSYVFFVLNKPLHFSISSALMIVTFYTLIYALYPRMEGNAFLIASVASAFVGLFYSLFYFRHLIRTKGIRGVE